MKPVHMLAAALLFVGISTPALAQTMFPANGASAVNPDVQLKMTFSSPPSVGASGSIRVYDAATDKLVDTLDLSLKPGPTDRATEPATSAPYLDDVMKGGYPYKRARRATNADTRPGTPSAGALPPPKDMQLTIIGGFTDGFHFYPVLVKDNTATIQLHHDLLQYGRSYYVEIDPGAITVSDGSFMGVSGKTAWRFTTKPKSAAPKAGATRLTVAADGSGDFNTVQGALDFVPDHSKTRVTIDVKPGVYQEIVYARNKDKVTLVGAGQDTTRITYANNERFNPHPDNLRTNERPGTFPSRRAAVALDNVSDFHIVNMTLETTAPGQAEGLLLNGQRNILDRVTVIGAGDAIQVNGPTYLVDTTVIGTGDTILGRGPTYWENCTLKSTQVFMWIRNTDKNHGNVFNGCTFHATAAPTHFARSPTNGKATYPYAEAVLLNSTLINIAPEGWGPGHDGGKIRFWEYNSRNPDGAPADVSKRAPWAKVLDKDKDAKDIADYSKPEFVLGGWKPVFSAPRPKAPGK